MNINVAWPSSTQWKAAARQAITFTSGLVGGGAAVMSFAVAMHLVSPDQSTNVLGALSNVANGVKLVVEGLGNIVTGAAALAAMASAAWSVYASSKKQQAASLAAKGDVVITDDKTAASVPSPNVVSASQTSAVITAAGVPVQVVSK